VAGEMNSSQLTVRIHKELKNKNSPAFTLDVSLEIPAGISILFGPSGAGKSTLLDCIAGLLRPHAGRIVVGDEVLFDTATGTNLPAQKRRIAYVFQSLALFPHMSVLQNVAYGLRHAAKDHASERASAILRAFRVENLAARRPAEISGGEKQRVALARSPVSTRN
jgi:molybdate transport system ATP-binding protein